MGKRVISILRPIVMALLIAASVTFTVLYITTAIISGTATVKADSVEHSHDGITFNAWTETDSLPTSGNYYLTNDFTISSTLNVSGTLNLCLNGHGIRLTSGTTIIKVNSGTFTLCDCGDTTHYFTAPENGYGKATNISDIDSGGQSSFIGGYITGGTAQAFDTGGGVHVTSGATFIMKGGTIIGNGYQGQEHIRGGGVAVIGGTFKMQGGAIMYNIVNNEGGGVYLRDAANMQMTGGIVSHNYAVNGSGGVHVSADVSFSMSGGEIAYNHVGTTAGEGGGMCAYQGSLTMTGGSIHHNSVGANGVGGGVLYKENGNLIVSGSASIINNTAGEKTQNIYIINKSIQIADALTAGAQFGVTLQSGAGTFTSGWSTYMEGKDPADYFTSDNDNYAVAKGADGEAKLVEAAVSVTVGETERFYGDLSSALAAWTDGSTLKLLKDVTAQITTSGGNKTLDLNDHSITYTGGTVIIVSGGTLRITDQSGIGTTHYYTPNLTGVATLSNTDTGYSFTGGYITGGVATEGRGGGLRVLGDGNVLFDSGTIFANSAGWGGGVWTNGSGSLTIEGTAAVIGNYSSGAYTSGGGIFMEGSSAVTMTGGSIRHNSAQWSGGGVRDCVDEKTGVRFTMIGGEITGNYAKNNQGNGFCFDAATTFNIGGTAKIIDNQGTNDIYFYNDRYLTVVAPFEEGALIGVTLQGGTGTFTSGWSTSMGDAEPADYFTSNIAGYTVIKDDNGELMMIPENAVAVVKNGTAFTYYIDFNSALSAWGDGCTLTLLKDVSITSTINVEEVTKTLDLNGHGIKMTGTGRVFTVINGATFNITDGNPQIEHKFTVSNGLATVNDDLQSGYQTFTGGYITGGNAKGGDENGWGGCLVVSLGGKRATLNISGGTIIGNRCDMSGAAIRVGGDKNDYTVVNMTGGAIMYNTAGQGGAVTWEPNVIVKISGGVINDNFVGSNEVNVYLENGQKITVDTAFTAAASIGVKLQNGQGVFTSGWSDNMGGADPADYFTSDVGYYVVPKNGEAVITDTLPHIHSWNYTADGNVITATCVEDGCTLSEQTLTITADGKSYDGTAVTAQLSLSDGWTVANGFEIPSIYYSDGVNAASTAAPVSVGTYTASITVGEKTSTVEFEIARKTETKIDDKTGDEQNAVSVVGLDLELANIENKNPDANSISLVMTVETKTDETAVNADSIIETAKNKSLEFFEIKVEKTIDSVTTVLDTTNNVLEIAISYEKAAKKGITVYSYHGENVITFVESDSKENGTFRVDKENGLIYIYSNSFSTYAIGYTPYYNVNGSISIGSFTGTAKITLVRVDDGLKFVYENVAMGSINFDDIPMGKYVMTIEWQDGVANAISMTVSLGGKGPVISNPKEGVIEESDEEFSEEPAVEPYSETFDNNDAEIISENPTANSISLVMTDETKTDETAVNADSIIETAKNKSLEFFEIKAEKTIDKENGTFRVDAENGIIYIYSNSFSAYSIGYTPYYTVNGSISIGSFDGTATITLIRVNDGLKFTYKNVTMESLRFNDIPMGKYVTEADRFCSDA